MPIVTIRGNGVQVVETESNPALVEGDYKIFLKRVKGRFDPSEEGWMATVSTKWSGRNTKVWTTRNEALTQGQGILDDMKKELQAEMDKIRDMEPLASKK